MGTSRLSMAWYRLYTILSSQYADLFKYMKTCMYWTSMLYIQITVCIAHNTYTCTVLYVIRYILLVCVSLTACVCDAAQGHTDCVGFCFILCVRQMRDPVHGTFSQSVTLVLWTSDMHRAVLCVFAWCKLNCMKAYCKFRNKVGFRVWCRTANHKASFSPIRKALNSQ